MPLPFSQYTTGGSDLSSMPQQYPHIPLSHSHLSVDHTSSPPHSVAGIQNQSVDTCLYMPRDVCSTIRPHVLYSVHLPAVLHCAVIHESHMTIISCTGTMLMNNQGHMFHSYHMTTSHKYIQHSQHILSQTKLTLVEIRV